MLAIRIGALITHCLAILGQACRAGCSIDQVDAEVVLQGLDDFC
jgi:hypothetical protein